VFKLQIKNITFTSHGKIKNNRELYENDIYIYIYIYIYISKCADVQCCLIKNLSRYHLGERPGSEHPSTRENERDNTVRPTASGGGRIDRTTTHMVHRRRSREGKGGRRGRARSPEQSWSDELSRAGDRRQIGSDQSETKTKTSEASYDGGVGGLD